MGLTAWGNLTLATKAKNSAFLCFESISFPDKIINKVFSSNTLVIQQFDDDSWISSCSLFNARWLGLVWQNWESGQRHCLGEENAKWIGNQANELFALHCLTFSLTNGLFGLFIFLDNRGWLWSALPLVAGMLSCFTSHSNRACLHCPQKTSFTLSGESYFHPLSPTHHLFVLRYSGRLSLS